jgi:hypothetical protein
MHPIHYLTLCTWQQLTVRLALPLLLSSTSWAAGNTAAQTYLISVGRLYESLEHERALDQIQLARQGPRSTEEEVTLSLYEGIILTELNQQEQGSAAFKSALLLEPDTKLPLQVAPKVEQLFESVRQKVKRELAVVLGKQETERRQAEDSPAPQAVPTQLSTGMSTTVLSTAPLGKDLRRYALLPAIAGGTLAVAGSLSWVISRSELSHLRHDAPSLATQEDVERTISRGKTFQQVGISLLSVGVAGLATAAGLYLGGAPSKSGALGVSTDGRSALLYGRWP